jgi:hypothetical protein
MKSIVNSYCDSKTISGKKNFVQLLDLFC